MTLVHNFSAGPSAIPKIVIEQIRCDFPNWNGTGMSVIEASHRGKEFKEIAQETESNLRLLLGVPKNYQVLFVQGGASLQFSMIPLNLSASTSVVDYVITGSWGKKAAKEGSKFSKVNIASDSIHSNYTSIQNEEDWRKSANADYLHITSNETIGGVEYNFVPKSKDIPIISDMSSSILSRPVDINKYGLIYAGAQKNIGPAGLTIVIIRKDLIGNARSQTPTLLNYKTYSDSESMYNTPPVFSWYVAGLVFKYLIDIGGLSKIESLNIEKASLLYEYIDQSEFYSNPVKEDYRSRMNIPFLLKDKSKEEEFIKQSHRAGLVNLKGHRSVGGMRASIYNALEIAAVNDLISFMRDFENNNG